VPERDGGPREGGWVREVFELKNPLGLAVRGHVLTPRGAPGEPPTVFLIHGYKGFKDWGFFPFLGASLASAGFRAVGFNFSGSGIGSDGATFSEVDLFERNTYSQELEDVSTVVRAFARPDESFPFAPSGPTALFGHSRGGGMALLSAARVPHLETLVSWSSISSTDRWDEAAKASWRSQGGMDVVNSRTGQRFRLRTDLLDDVERNAGRLDIESAARGLTIPFLIVHGEKDESVGAEEGRRLFGWKTAHTGRESDPAAVPAGLSQLPVPPEASLRWGPEGSLLVLLPWAGHTFDAVHPLPDPPPERLAAVVRTTAAWLRWHLLASKGPLS